MLIGYGRNRIEICGRGYKGGLSCREEYKGTFREQLTSTKAQQNPEDYSEQVIQYECDTTKHLV